MIIEKENIDIDRSGNVTEAAFAMEATSHAFDILSSGLYSDKPLAVVRELACNAHDSHVAAGYPTRPIEIHLPSLLDLTFYVKDFGTGLTDFEIRGGWQHRDTGQQVSDLDMTMSAEQYVQAGFVRTTGIYNTYFRSTKTKSNDFIGQLGLGSKSPFSYASTFNVESRKDGKVRLYTCYKNESGTPVIALMSELDTTEENGVTVSMAVRRDDVTKFHTAARSALMYFNPVPDVRGVEKFKPYEMVHTIKGNTWRVRQAEYYAYMTGPYVVQGFVAYPVDVNLLSEGGLTGAALQIAKANIDLYVPIGAARPAASREALQYDRRTVINLIEALQVVAGELRQSFQAEFDLCTSQYEAAVLFDKFSQSGGDALKKVFSALHVDQPFRWNDQPILTTLKLDLSGIKGTVITRVGKTKYRKRTLNTVATWRASDHIPVQEVPIQGNMVFIFSERASGTNTQFRDYVDSLPDKNGRPAQLFIVRVQDKLSVADAMACRDSIINQFGVTFIDGKTLPPATSTSRSRSGGSSTPAIGAKRTKTDRYVWNGFTTKTNYWGRTEIHRVFSRNCWAVKSVTLEDGGLFIPIVGFVPTTPSHIGRDIDEYLKMAVREKLIDTTEIIAMNEKEQAAALKSGGKWINVFDYLQPKFKKAVPVNKLNDREALTLINSQTVSSMKDMHRAFTTGPLANLGTNKMRSFFERYHEIATNASKASDTEVNNWVKFSRASINGRPKAEEMVADWKLAVNDYPLLGMLPWDKLVVNKSVAEAMTQYVNLVDTTMKTEDSGTIA